MASAILLIFSRTPGPAGGLSYVNRDRAVVQGGCLVNRAGAAVPVVQGALVVGWQRGRGSGLGTGVAEWGRVGDMLRPSRVWLISSQVGILRVRLYGREKESGSVRDRKNEEIERSWRGKQGIEKSRKQVRSSISNKMNTFRLVV